MNVRFSRNPEIHEMQVSVPGTGLVQLFPPLPDVDLMSGFQLLTDKGSVYGDFRDYTTVYRNMEDGSVILSNDGRIWSPPPPSEPPTLEELQIAKKREIEVACEQAIYAGISVKLPGGWERFSLTEKDQINLFGKQSQLAAGVERLEYHQDGHPCRYYTAEEMQAIITAAMEHVSYHTTYCNALNVWIMRCESEVELQGIFYGVDIPEEYQSEVLKDYLAKVMEETGKEVEDAAVS